MSALSGSGYCGSVSIVQNGVAKSSPLSSMIPVSHSDFFSTQFTSWSPHIPYTTPAHRCPGAAYRVWLYLVSCGFVDVCSWLRLEMDSQVGFSLVNCRLAVLPVANVNLTKSHTRTSHHILLRWNLSFLYHLILIPSIRNWRFVGKVATHH